MTLPLPPTLVDLRQSVAVRAGLAGSGNLAARSTPLIDELLRQAQTEIYLRCAWARIWRTTDITLTTGERDYDIPADTVIGNIGPIWVKNLDGRPFPVQFEDMLEVEWVSQDLQANGRPMTWNIVNDILRISPAPDAAVWPNLTLHYQQAPNTLTSDQSRASIDGEALIQLATIRLKENMGIGGPQQPDIARFERYLYDLRAASSPARVYATATRHIDGPAYWTSPSADTYTTPWISGWNPPGASW